ncbi:uncharacterized protein TRIVIDRAFT_200342 [Trichoderma virens Gv29-8]|uniref:Uncharacterized protein n=1 Tax=Hypocrea virens (strain Gv29-8 / FGSC 10586) TaxID=413071 RepID=G9MQ78_HYPVG|nr:uncharacterized protein TRIVIDRAFT_200342 [Trichoderma virens Gv29-8]EHK24025.1 hypothetical protein TRIVIDRAFT_200342 [Trichoderma virens Gv29-8]
MGDAEAQNAKQLQISTSIANIRSQHLKITTRYYSVLVSLIVFIAPSEFSKFPNNIDLCPPGLFLYVFAIHLCPLRLTDDVVQGQRFRQDSGGRGSVFGRWGPLIGSWVVTAVAAVEDDVDAVDVLVGVGEKEEEEEEEEQQQQQQYITSMLPSLIELETNNTAPDNQQTPAVAGGRGPEGALSRRQKKILARAQRDAGLSAEEIFFAAPEQHQQQQQQPQPQPQQQQLLLPAPAPAPAPALTLTLAPGQQQQEEEDVEMGGLGAPAPAQEEGDQGEAGEEGGQQAKEEEEDDEDQMVFEQQLDETIRWKE